MTTWWDEHNRLLESAHPSMARSILPAHLVTLLDDVEARFVATSTVPGWPDPHADPSLPWPGHRSPEEAEYSRVTNSGRYQILLERVGAWLDELVARELAVVEEVPVADAWLIVPTYGMDRVRRAVPTRSGAVPLVLGTSEPGPDSPAVAVIGAGARAVMLDIAPYCGCDACDDGSAALLQTLDEAVLRVIDGSLRIDVTPGHTSLRFAGGSSELDVSDGADRRARRTAMGADHYTADGAPWDPSWPARRALDV